MGNCFIKENYNDNRFYDIIYNYIKYLQLLELKNIKNNLSKVLKKQKSKNIRIQKEIQLIKTQCRNSSI